jgi:folate-binding protein YgfZ
MQGQAYLSDRGVVKVTGADATMFLHKIVTNSVLDIPAGESRYSALLTAQGKLLFDFFVVPLPEGSDAGYFLDCLREASADFAKRLNFYKMRWKIAIEDVSDTLGVAAVWGTDAPPAIDGTVARDMRSPGMGFRVIANRAALAALTPSDAAGYEAHRITCGVPKGGLDFPYGETFVHDANLDFLHGVDFKKGCYVGQEVVARVHFRNSARKRILKVRFDGPTPEPGTPVMIGEANIGEIGSSIGSEGLAALRIDRLEEAKADGATVTAGQARVEVSVPPEFAATAGGVEKRL